MSVNPPPAVAAYRAALPPGRVLEFPIGAIDRIDVPTWSVTFWAEQGVDGGGHGYGTTEAEAMTSAWGELSEQVHASAGVRRLPRRSASYRQLVGELGPRRVLDPAAACPPAGSPHTPDRVVQWVPAARWGTDEQVLVPVELVAFQHADLGPGEWLWTPITNGMGAGPTLEHALGHALLELVQRDGNSVAFRVMDRGVVVEPDAVADPTTRETLRRLDERGVDVLIKLAGTDFGMANLFVVGIDRDAHGDPLMATACGEAAHPDREVALRKALLEFTAARARKAFTHGPLGPVERVTPPGYLADYLEQYRRRGALAGEEARALRTMVEWRRFTNEQMRALLADSVLAERSRVRFSELPTVPSETVRDRADLARLVTNRLAEAGLDVLYADLSPPHAPNVRVVQAIVPGLEVETMTYYWIGMRNLGRLLDRGSDLVGLGDGPPGGRPIVLTEHDRERLGQPAWLDVQAVDRAVGRLYPLYREPGRHAAALVLEQRGR